jgi:hypothetical protein
MAASTREREYLTAHDGWMAAITLPESAEEFDRLEELRSLLRALRHLVDQVLDKDLKAEVQQWLALESRLSIAVFRQYWRV